MHRFTAVFLIALGLLGCTGRGATRLVGPPAALGEAAAAFSASETGLPLPAGELVGRVLIFDGKAFQPAAQVQVTAAEPGVTATTDSAGRYGFGQLPIGTVKLTVSQAGYETFSIVSRLSAAAGTPRANLVLVPTARPAALAGDAVAVAGVLMDPRGAALPGGTVHAVDAVSNGGKGGNEKVVADGDGCFAYILPAVGHAALANGQAQLTGFGVTPGGVNVETTAILTLVVDARPTQAVVVGTTAFLGVAAPVWAGGERRTRALTADKLPQRRDELVLHFDQDGRTVDVAPDTLEPDKVTFTLPEGIQPGHGTLEVRTLGLVPAPAVPIGS